MAIINRLARLFKADFHAVLDHIEEPELQLMQAIREMEEELSKLDVDIQQHTCDIDNLTDRKKNADALIAQTNDEIAICFENKNDELARGLVRKKLETTAMLTVLEQSINKAGKTLKTLESQHKEYLALHESMQQKADLIVKPKDASFSNAAFNTSGRDTFSVSDNDIEVALLKERQRFGSHDKAKTNAN